MLKITGQKRISTVAMEDDMIDQIWHRPKNLRNKIPVVKFT